MKKSNPYMLAALASLTLSGASLSTISEVHAATKGDYEKCFGINKCANFHECGISKKDIAAANQQFKNKFSKSITHDCAGQGKCGAKSKNLNWVYVAKGRCFKIADGFQIAKKDGKKVIVTE